MFNVGDIVKKVSKTGVNYHFLFYVSKIVDNEIWVDRFENLINPNGIKVESEVDLVLVCSVNNREDK